MKKLLLALQFWEGDKAQAGDLMRLVSDLEPNFCEIADVLLVARFDCPHDPEMIVRASKKFKVSHFTCKRRGVGWPSGCNELWFGTMEWIWGMQVADRIPDYSGVLTFEADCCPLHPGWIGDVKAEWEEKAACVGGAMVKAPGIHINGNAVFSTRPDFLYWVARQARVNPRWGWDYALASEFKRWGWRNLSTVRSLWGTKTTTEETVSALRGEGVSLLHGVKDNSALRIVRKNYLDARQLVGTSR